MLKLKQ
jgi:hypothetical protein